MIKAIKAGECVKLLDGRIGRVRTSKKKDTECEYLGRIAKVISYSG